MLSLRAVALRRLHHVSVHRGKLLASALISHLATIVLTSLRTCPPLCPHPVHENIRMPAQVYEYTQFPIFSTIHWLAIITLPWNCVSLDGLLDLFRFQFLCLSPRLPSGIGLGFRFSFPILCCPSVLRFHDRIRFLTVVFLPYLEAVVDHEHLILVRLVIEIPASAASLADGPAPKFRGGRGAAPLRPGTRLSRHYWGDSGRWKGWMAFDGANENNTGWCLQVYACEELAVQ
ncbi:hypothetical protein BC834DRAFT_901651 [Gloeopeniophorella convolvens]|nr:hypothetical protein BC834DRAFT_901651 [Gloeopeniophorella convolvens]